MAVGPGLGLGRSSDSPEVPRKVIRMRAPVNNTMNDAHAPQPARHATLDPLLQTLPQGNIGLDIPSTSRGNDRNLHIGKAPFSRIKYVSK